VTAKDRIIQFLKHYP